MSASVDDVQRGNWHDKLVGRFAGQLCQVLVERYVATCGTSASDGKGHGQNRVCSNLLLAPTPLVLGAVKLLNHLLVDFALLSHVHTSESR